jgi:hypothetical protein
VADDDETVVVGESKWLKQPRGGVGLKADET